MAQFVGHGPCPFCSSSDAFAQYDDGGYHCFSCGAHAKGNAYVTLKQVIANLPQDRQHKIEQRFMELKPVPPLPEDAQWLLDSLYDGAYKARHWLNKYGITNAEIDKHTFLWSEEKQLLIFPVWDGFDLLMWQGRYFGDNPRHPKYITRGLKESVVHIIGPDKPGPLVLTEDVISAIKVGRQQIAMPLWGSFVSKEMAQRLSTMWDEVVLWLDYDKRDESVKQAIKHSLVLGITPLITKLDPKCHTDEEIKQYLTR